MNRKKAILVLAAYVVSVLAAMVWLWTHEACLHPVGNLLAFAWLWVATLGVAEWIGGESDGEEN